MADIGEPKREVEIPAQDPAWTVPDEAPVKAPEPVLVPA